MDVDLVFQGLAARAATITGLRTAEYAPDAITVPMFFPVDVNIDFDKTFQRGMDDWTIKCRLLVSGASDRAGQKELKGYLKGSGPKSIKAALEALPRSLGGACDDLHVTGVSGYGRYEHNGNHFYGAEFSVRVIGDGS